MTALSNLVIFSAFLVAFSDFAVIATSGSHSASVTFPLRRLIRLKSGRIMAFRSRLRNYTLA